LKKSKQTNNPLENTPKQNHSPHINSIFQKVIIIYLITDGYQDQFGGEKGKKFKASNLKELIVSIKSETMENQKNLIDEAFETWRGKLEQIDDVCIIGIRV
jgi:serine phosphatase RsbU (regulator of sigma subunit)